MVELFLLGMSRVVTTTSYQLLNINSTTPRSNKMTKPSINSLSSISPSNLMYRLVVTLLFTTMLILTKDTFMKS